MNPSPTANQSFLHSGGQNATPISDNLVYATLDSVALKRTRLPLQLLPMDDGNVAEKTEKTEKPVREKRVIDGKNSSNKWPTYKVKSGTSHQWKNYSKYLIFPSTKSENQSIASTRMPSDSTIKCDIENTLPCEKNEIKAEENLKNSLEHCAGATLSPLTNDQSLISDFQHHYSNDLIRPQTENKSHNCINIANNSRGKEKRSISRKDSSSSSDYEKMNVTDCKMSDNERWETNTGDPEISNNINSELVTCNNIAPKTIVRPPDPITGEISYEKILGYLRQDMVSITSDEDDVASRKKTKNKKKKRFTRNVLYYVPQHLTKQPKKKKKKKKTKTKKYELNTSLSSLRPISRTFSQDSRRTKSQSREKLKGVIISSPTNFVHVASATNRSLIPNENTIRSSLEQIVITHQQVCATLPLLIKKDKYCQDRNGKAKRSKVIEQMSPIYAHFSESDGERANKTVTNKNERTNYVVIKGESMLRELPSKVAKVLGYSQLVKTMNENQVDLPEGETYKPVCEHTCDSLLRATPRANCSFLWNKHRAKNLLNDQQDATTYYSLKENNEGTDNEAYDDVGPSNFAAQADSDYDDVGPPISHEEIDKFVVPDKNEEIYDDVLPPNLKHEDSRTTNENDDYLIPESSETREELFAEVRTHLKNREVASHYSENNDQYFSANNEYSNVDESYLEVDEQNELDVYDDVGLPSDERVNSLYSGSTPGSVLGLTSMMNNGKESEWEDLEEVSNISHCFCHRNNSCDKGTQGQIVSCKKKFVRRWSRRGKKQRSRRSRRGTKITTRATIDRSAIYVAVSLGTGSILLIGESGQINGEWKATSTKVYCSQRTQGLVQLRIISLDEDMDIQETSCYVHEDSASDDSTYESLHSCQQDDFSTDSEVETNGTRQRDRDDNNDRDCAINPYPDCPTRPIPPPPREASLTQSLGKRIKMLRRTWSITKGSLGRIRRRTSVDECFDDKESGNEHHLTDAGKYFNFRRHFRKTITAPSIFYLDKNNENDNNGAINNNNGKEMIYSNSQYMGSSSSSSDDSSKIHRAQIDHYSVLADQEPLYQFYADAVARVAFESDSEGYEEVEDTVWKATGTATNLARLGQRMLWCHTPQVRHSGLLQRLTPEEKKIQEAKFEILTSEASYLNSLRVLENEFLNNQTLMNEVLTSSEGNRLFGGVPAVLSASQTFLAELEAVWREDPMLPGLPDVLLRHAEKCEDTYVAYCSNQVSIDMTLKELRTRKGTKFLEAIKRIEMRPACQNLSLHSFLMLPMQRVTRLPLLADAILSKLSMGNSDKTSWEKVLSSLSNVVAECNEGARAATQEAEMEALARKLEYSAKIKPILLRGKQLIRKGSVVQLSMKTDTEYKLTFGKKFNKTPLYLLLLTDYLLVTKLKTNTHEESYTVIDACKRNLLALESASEESPFAGRNAMILTFLENNSARRTPYILTCENNTERERWLEAVSPPKRGLVGETLYESWDCPQVMAKYAYSPNQPDELSLQSGDVINVLTKMADGWYHGEKLLDGEQGWFPANYTKEVASEHVRARNLKQRHRLLALSSSVLQQRRTKQNLGIY